MADNAIPLKATLVWTDYPGTPAAAVELVNDLNLTATDGVSTYKGNVYSGGQSTTGGTADARNVEECVRRNTPTVGLWTFRVQAAERPVRSADVRARRHRGPGERRRDRHAGQGHLRRAGQRSASA